jgi:PAS domain S-box-containing protein
VTSGLVRLHGYQPALARLTRFVSPPIGRREFWIVQVLVLAIALGHYLNEAFYWLDLQGADFIPVSLFLIPVVYAGLAFGTRGASLTAVWAFALTVPNVAIVHEGADAIGELWQAALVVGIGIFVGRRVDQERRMRLEAEVREKQRRASDQRYRGLFEAAADPIVVLDETGVVFEANPAAKALCSEAAHGTRLQDHSPRLWQAIRATLDGSTKASRPAPLMVEHVGGRMWVEPAIVRFHDADGRARILTQLHDVTPIVDRQRLMEDFARRTVATREAERRRIARELHDGPLQSLVLISRQFDAFDSVCCPEGSEAMVQARRRVEELARELRRFSRDLRPSLLDDLGLTAALSAEVDRVRNRSGIDARFERTGAPLARLPADTELALLRICQEGLRNVVRHAQAGRALVRFESSGTSYQLSVADDGVGVDALPEPGELIGAGRLGIVGMHERARLVGASCSIGQQGGWSTVIQVIGDLADAAADRQLTAAPSSERSLVTDEEVPMADALA